MSPLFVFHCRINAHNGKECKEREGGRDLVEIELEERGGSADLSSVQKKTKNRVLPVAAAVTIFFWAIPVMKLMSNRVLPEALPIFYWAVPLMMLQQTTTVCVCVLLASGYRWVTVMHEIPVSSAHPLTSLPYPRTW